MGPIAHGEGSVVFVDQPLGLCVVFVDQPLALCWALGMAGDCGVNTGSSVGHVAD